MTIKINSQFGNKAGKTVETVVIELAKAHARDVAATVTDVTDSSGGTDAAGVVVAASVAQVNVANSGTSLAQKAATETALGTVKDALVELFAKANAYATALGLATVTYSGGGTAADGTVAAMTVATTAATTGAQAVETNAQFALINNAFYNVASLTNKIAKATGFAPLTVYTDVAQTVPAIAGTVGTAADPGVTKVAVDAALATFRANAATIATKLNAVNAGNTVALVVAV